MSRAVSALEQDMPVEGWRERHGTCRFSTYRAAAAEGFVEAACTNQDVANRYCEQFCATECPAYAPRSGPLPHGRIPLCRTVPPGRKTPSGESSD